MSYSCEYLVSCDSFRGVVLELSSSYTSTFLDFSLWIDSHPWTWKTNGNTSTGLGMCKGWSCTLFSVFSNKLSSAYSICRSESWWFECVQWKRRHSWQSSHSGQKSRRAQWCFFSGVQLHLMVFSGGEAKCVDAYLSRLKFMTRVFSFLFRCLQKYMERRSGRSIRRLANIILTCHNLKAALKGSFFSNALSEKKCLKLDMLCSKKRQISAD